MRSVVVAVVALLTLTACSDSSPGVPEEVRGPFVACEPSTRSGGLTLPCFADGAEVAIPPVGKPAVLTLWASYCGPCRDELPAFQRLWDRARDRVTVLGIVTNDTRTASAALAEDLKLTFPSVFDRAGRFQRDQGRSALPVTVFVDATGTVVYSHVSAALDDKALAELVRDKLGVALE